MNDIVTIGLFAVGGIHRLWYALPLLVSISLVYGATRAERMRPIVMQAVQFLWWMVVFMGVLYVAVRLLSAGL